MIANRADNANISSGLLGGCASLSDDSAQRQRHLPRNHRKGQLNPGDVLSGRFLSCSFLQLPQMRQVCRRNRRVCRGESEFQIPALHLVVDLYPKPRTSPATDPAHFVGDVLGSVLWRRQRDIVRTLATKQNGIKPAMARGPLAKPGLVSCRCFQRSLPGSNPVARVPTPCEGRLAFRTRPNETPRVDRWWWC